MPDQEEKNTPVPPPPPLVTPTPTGPVVMPTTPRTTTFQKLAIITSLVLFLLILIGALGYGIAYEKITVNNPQLEYAVSDLVQSLSFTPKTPKYLLASSVLAQKKISKHSLEASFLIETPNPAAIASGFGRIDGKLTGAVDYENPKNPLLIMNLSVTKDFNMDFRKKDNFLYFKINKLPKFLLTSILGAQTADQLDQGTNTWVAFDASPLESEARKALEENQKKTSYTNSEVQKMLNEFLDNRNRLLPEIKVTDDKVDQFESFKLTLALTDDLFDYLVEKTAKVYGDKTMGLSKERPSDYVKNSVLTFWIDKQHRYLRKFTWTAKVQSKRSTSSYDSPLFSPEFAGSSADVSFALKLSDFGKPVVVEIPSNSISPDELYKRVFGENAGLLNAINPSKQFSQANNTKRRSDVNALLNAIRQYMADNKGVFPPGIASSPYIDREVSQNGANLCSSLVPRYIAGLPVDPLVNNGTPVFQCGDSYKTGYSVSRTPDNKITITAPNAEQGEKIEVTR